MSKNKQASGIVNVFQYDNYGNVSIVSGSTTLMQISSSGQIYTTGIISGSSVQSSSLAQNSNLLQGTGSVGFASTASVATASGSVSSRLTQIETVYATTGSNSFRANQSITGSLTVTSTVTAQTLVVQTITSSIEYSSGSNIFGSQLTDKQTFTGSLQITGSTLNVSSLGSVGVGIYPSNWDSSWKVVELFNQGNFVGSESGKSTWLGSNNYYSGSAYKYANTNGAAQYILQYDGAHKWRVAGSGTAGNTISWTDALFLSNTGNFGIGTTNPTYPLTVSGSMRAFGNQTDLALNSTGSGQYSRISFEENGVDKAQVQYINSAFSSGNRAGRLEICNASSGGQGIAFVSAVAAFNTPQMFISSSGNVGIGTTTPTTPLHLYTSGDGYNMLQVQANGGDAGIQLRGNSVAGGWTIQGRSNGQLSFTNRYGGGNTDVMIISGSNLGIGITTPSTKLHIYDGSNPISLKIQRTTVPVYLSDIATAVTTAGSSWSHNVENTSNGSVSWGSFANSGYAGSAILLNANTVNSWINFHTANGTNTNPTERLRITGEGYVNVTSDTANSMGGAALNVYQSGSGAGVSGNQIWIKGGNTNIANNSNSIVLSYGSGLLYSHAIKTTHNSAAINGNAIDFYVWNYGTDSTSTIGTRKMMSVDGLGVIKPNQPAFQVTRGSSANQTLANENTILQFNTVTFDTLGNFNTSTYTFTAPVAGRYLFCSTVRYDNSVNNTGYIRAYFTVNGYSGVSGVSFNYGHQILGPGGYSTSYQSCTISAVIQLSSGDSVQVRGGHTSGTELQKESQFSGYLLG